MCRRIAASVAIALLALLTACSPSMTVYRGVESGIDGVLWRQVASVEDPLSGRQGITGGTSAQEYFSMMGIVRWDDAASPVPDLGQPVIVASDVVESDRRVTFAAFLSSGMRLDVPTDRGQPYSGPDSVFTCYVLTVTFGTYGVDHIERSSESAVPEDCPAELVAAMPGVTSYAEPGVFDG